jgi:hypothetical protein
MDYVLATSSAIKAVKTPKFAVWEPKPCMKSTEEVAEAAEISAETKLFEQLYQAHPTSSTAFQSLHERKNGGNQFTINSTPGSLVYGEVIDMRLIHEILDVLHSENILTEKNTDFFYDLGSGSGKMVIAAALTKTFQHCVGVEVLSSLHKVAIEVGEEYSRLRIIGADHVYPTVEFIHGNLLDLTGHDWTRAGCIYINSTCFDEGLMHDIAVIASERLKTGTVVITLSSIFPKKLGFHLLREIRQDLSW